MTSIKEEFNGYTLNYRQGDFEVTVRNTSTVCDDFVNDLAQFLLSCGYSPQNIINAFFDIAALLDGAWFDGKVLETEMDAITDAVIEVIKKETTEEVDGDLEESADG